MAAYCIMNNDVYRCQNCLTLSSRERQSWSLMMSRSSQLIQWYSEILGTFIKLEMNLPKNENTMRIIIRWSMIKSLRVVAAQWRAGPSWYCNTIWEALCLQINGIVSPLYLAGTSTQCHVAQPAAASMSGPFSARGVRRTISRYLLFPWKLNTSLAPTCHGLV